MPDEELLLLDQMSCFRFKKDTNKGRIVGYSTFVTPCSTLLTRNQFSSFLTWNIKKYCLLILD